MRVPGPSPALVLALAVAAMTSSCASPPQGPQFEARYLTTVTWSAAGPVTLPLYPIRERGELAFVTVELRVNGHDARFVVDSGSSRSWFTTRFTRSLRAEASGQKIEVQGAGGTRRHDMVVFDEVDLGFARLRPLWVISADLLEDVNRTLISRADRPVAGLLALDVLDPLGASVDLAHYTITFRPKAPPGAPPPGALHP